MDLDGDGIPDILSGSWPGELYCFHGQGKGKFAAGEKIKDKDGKEIKLSSASTVFAADWNGDGLLDLIVGSIGGEVYFVPNEGTAKKFAFGKALKLEAGGQEIRAANGDSHPVVADWDGDGKPDLIVGASAGSVLWYRNIGAAKEPKLAAAQVLVPERSKQEVAGKERQQGCGLRTKVCVTDWNGDGKLDLLVGDFSSEAPQLTHEEKEAEKKVQEEYRKIEEEYAPFAREQQELRKAPDNETAEAKAQREQKLQDSKEKAKKIVEQLLKMQLQMAKNKFSGSVWLFLRKTNAVSSGP